MKKEKETKNQTYAEEELKNVEHYKDIRTNATDKTMINIIADHIGDNCYIIEGNPIEYASLIIKKCQKPTVYYSLSAPSIKTFEYIMAWETALDLNSATCYNSPLNIKSVVSSMNSWSKYPFWIDDTENMSITRLYKKCEWMKESHVIKAIIIDDIKLLLPDEDSENSENMVCEITKSLHVLSHSLGITVIAFYHENPDWQKHITMHPFMEKCQETIEKIDISI